MARGFVENFCSTLRLRDRGPVITVKLSPDQRLLAVQRTSREVQLASLTTSSGRELPEEHTQPCKTKGAALLGLSWLDDRELAFFTDKGVELYGVSADARGLRLIRAHSQQTAWYHFCPESNVLVTAPNKSSSHLLVFSIRGGYVYKLSKVECEREVVERDVFLCRLYRGRLYVGIVASREQPYSIITLYAVSVESGTTTKTHVLKVNIAGSNGSLTTNTVDDLLLVHHPQSASTFVYDVSLPGEFDGNVTRLDPLCKATMILAAPLDSAQSQETGKGSSRDFCMNWVAFQPDVIIDAKQGVMWKLKLKLESTLLSKEIRDPCQLVSFLSQREGAKGILLQVLLLLCVKEDVKLRTVGKMFDLLNLGYRRHVDQAMQQQMALPASTFNAFKSSPSLSSLSSIAQSAAKMPPSLPLTKVVVDQADLFTGLFSRLLEKVSSQDDEVTIAANTDMVIALLTEYYRSLEQNRIPAQHFLNELLINLLVQRRAWFQLHILLQYRVIGDSKPLACLLLSLESAYEPAHQLAMDMLSRLRDSTEEVCEVLLAKGLVVPALKHAAAGCGAERVPVKKYLEAAEMVGDESLFFNVFNWFKDKNLIPKKLMEEYSRHTPVQ